MSFLRQRLLTLMVAFATAAIAAWFQWRPSEAEAAAIAAAETWIDVLAEDGYAAACSERYVGENWARNECESELQSNYASGENPSWRYDDTIYLSELLPEHAEGQRVLVIFRSKRQSGVARKAHVVMALQSEWKVDGFFLHDGR